MTIKKDDKCYCSAYDCLIKTCSRHKCHIPRRYTYSLNWGNFSDDCGMYKSLSKWRTLFEDRTAQEEVTEGTKEDAPEAGGSIG